MHRLYCKIKIGAYTFNYVDRVEVVSSWDMFTDTATITLPSKFQDDNKNIVKPEAGKTIFKSGDAVTIQLGYFPTLNTIFTGYVKSIVPDSPMVIQCEDAAWKLKQQNIEDFTQKNCTLSQLIQHLVGSTGIEYECVDANIGTFRISNKDYVNVVDVLDELKSNFGLYSWCRDGKLYVGYPTSQTFYDVNELTYSFQANIINSSLEYRVVDMMDIVVQGVSIALDNSKITRYCYYDNDGKIIVSSDAKKGEQRTFNYIALSQTDLDNKLKEILPALIYSGYSGNFTTFGNPVTMHGDRVKITDKKFPERDGTYFTKTITTSFGMDGYRQVIDLESRLS